jgi:hypothetical protein
LLLQIDFFCVFRFFDVYHSFKTRPGPARQVNLDPANPGLEPGRVYQKIKEVKNSANPATWLTWQESVKNSVATR